MTEDNPYSPLGFPLTNLPCPGQPIDGLTLYDTLNPLLHGPRALTIGIIVSLRTGDLDPERASWALATIEGLLESAHHLLQRFDQAQDPVPDTAIDA
jgi:hypothetical protein